MVSLQSAILNIISQSSINFNKLYGHHSIMKIKQYKIRKNAGS